MEANLASKKKKREAMVGKAKKELAKTKRKAKEKAMEVCKASMDFVALNAQAVVAFRPSEEFYDDHHQFSKEAFCESFKLGRDKYRLLVMAEYLEMDFFHMDKESEEGLPPLNKKISHWSPCPRLPLTK